MENGHSQPVSHPVSQSPARIAFLLSDAFKFIENIYATHALPNGHRSETERQWQRETQKHTHTRPKHRLVKIFFKRERKNSAAAGHDLRRSRYKLSSKRTTERTYEKHHHQQNLRWPDADDIPSSIPQRATSVTLQLRDAIGGQLAINSQTPHQLPQHRPSTTGDPCCERA